MSYIAADLDTWLAAYVARGLEQLAVFLDLHVA